MRASALAVGLVLLVAARPALAQDLGVLIPGGSDIVEVRLIKADSMSLTQRAGEPQVLRGDVEVIVIDRDKQESRIRAMKISMFMTGEPRQIDRLIAEGQVIIEREGMTAKTELAVYDGRQSTVDLLQDNYVQDARGELTADRIRINLATNQVSAEGNVRGVIYPKELASADDAP